MTLLMIGSGGDEVRQIQSRLQSLGLYRGPVDGAYGGGTGAAVKAFQLARGLEVDGEVDSSTWSALFDGAAPPRPVILDRPLNYRCLALTGSIETGCSAPECFCALSGDFDGQGLSFGVLQWNFGKETLQPMLRDFLREHPDAARDVFHDQLGVVAAALDAPRDELLNFVRAIQHPVKHTIFEPWCGMAKTLGRTPQFQAMEARYAADMYGHALAMCDEYALMSERAVALMFDIRVQNGAISPLTKARIDADVARLPADLDRLGREIATMRSIANRRADAANPIWVEDVRARKLAIANGEGVVHGIHYDLAAQFGITLNPFAASPPLVKA
jgi:hypothetical protein